MRRPAPTNAAQPDVEPHDLSGSHTLRRASQPELVVLLIYFSVIVTVTDVLNIRLGIELLTLTVVVAAFGISRAGAHFLRDWWFFLLGLLLWSFSGPIAAESPFPLHMDGLIQADRVLFLGHDPVVLLQHTFLHPGRVEPLHWAMGTIYNLHLAEPYIAGYFLWRLNRLVYLQFVAAVLSLLVLGYITFILLPTVPPWMASTWYHRIPAVYNGFKAVLVSHPLPFHGTPIFYIWHLKGDAVAAVPSEHAAFPVLEYLAFSRVFSRARPLLLLWVAVVLFTVVCLGMHWVIDALIGWAYALAVFWGVRRVSR
ncbi:MAG: hypothetical protein PVSMB7_15200 [Chloroflexota bacterium]